MKREIIFRDAEEWYANRSGYASGKLVNFAESHSGNRVLDIGCATGEYIQRLIDRGFECVGIDDNLKYVEEAKTKGLKVYNMDAKHLAFPDKSFDTTLLFEVLEHIDDPAIVLREAKRVAKKNVLITVPDCTGFDKLSSLGLTFEHMLEKDHVNFFTKSELEDLLSDQFKDYEVKEAEPVFLSLADLPQVLRIALRRMYRWRLICPMVYCRLYAIAKVE